MRVLILTNCTSRKNIGGRCVSADVVRREVSRLVGRVPDFDVENEHLYRGVLSKHGYVRMAIDLYCGPTFSMMRDLYRIARRCHEVDMYIMSGRYGLVEAHELIIPYDAHIRMAPSYVKDRIVSAVNVRFRNEVLPRCPYDVAVVCLTREYYHVLRRAVQSDIVLIARKFKIVRPRELYDLLEDVGISAEYYRSVKEVVNDLCDDREV